MTSDSKFVGMTSFQDLLSPFRAFYWSCFVTIYATKVKVDFNWCSEGPPMCNCFFVCK